MIKLNNENLAKLFDENVNIDFNHIINQSMIKALNMCHKDKCSRCKYNQNDKCVQKLCGDVLYDNLKKKLTINKVITDDVKQCAFIFDLECKLDGHCATCPHCENFIKIIEGGLIGAQKDYYVARFNEYIEVHKNVKK